jgi:hypothetical protein
VVLVKGSQVQILSARQKQAGDLRKRRSPFSLDEDHPPKTHRFQVWVAATRPIAVRSSILAAVDQATGSQAARTTLSSPIAALSGHVAELAEVVNQLAGTAAPAHPASGAASEPHRHVGHRQLLVSLDRRRFVVIRTFAQRPLRALRRLGQPPEEAGRFGRLRSVPVLLGCPFGG